MSEIELIKKPNIFKRFGSFCKRIKEKVIKPKIPMPFLPTPPGGWVPFLGSPVPAVGTFQPATIPVNHKGPFCSKCGNSGHTSPSCLGYVTGHEKNPIGGPQIQHVEIPFEESKAA